jgi:membrane peptidoglycan carboxypeptidase
LNALESVFLIRLLPSPIVRHVSWEKNAVSDHEMSALHRVLKKMKELGRLTSVEYEDAMNQRIIFYREGDPAPVPRPGVFRLAPGDSDFGSSEEDLDEEEQVDTSDSQL